MSNDSQQNTYRFFKAVGYQYRHTESNGDIVIAFNSSSVQDDCCWIFWTVILSDGSTKDYKESDYAK